MASGVRAVAVEVDGHSVKVSNPDKVFFSARGETKLDLVRYYFAVGPGALRGVRERPTVLKRYPDGAEGPFFYQKRVPAGRPPWLETVTVTFPSGRSAEELCPVDVAHILWAVNLGCLDLNPWPVRRADTDHPDELRVDLDPQPGVPFDAVRRVALEARAVLEEHGLVGFPKTSGSRGIHVNVPIEPRWSFTEVRRAALALAREVERRLPDIATSAWWKEQRGSAGVHRLQPERAGPDRGVGLLGAGEPRGAGVVPAGVGRGARRRTRRPHHRHGARSLRRPGRPGGRHRRARATTWARCSSWPTATRPRARRRALAAALRQAARRAQPGGTEQGAPPAEP